MDKAVNSGVEMEENLSTNDREWGIGQMDKYDQCEIVQKM